MQLVHYPHPALLTRTETIEPGQIEDLEDRITEMFRLMNEHRGIGLAAPQVGWNVRLCCINITEEPEDNIVLINPKIVKAEGRELGEEGCLSFPGIYAKILRATDIVVEYQNENFDHMQMECSGLLARVVQHEIDHLDRILLVHRMSEADKSVNKKKLKELKEKATQN